MPIKILVTFVTALCCSLSYAETVKMLESIDYDPDSSIQQNVRLECIDLGTKLSSFTQEFGKAYGVEVELVSSIDTAAPGKVLQVYITEAVSSGNAFIGHRKYVKVRGELWENGTKVSEFTGGRYSGGGAFGGYKGSCAVLGRCVKALGKDIAQWLRKPINKASLGNG